MNELAKASKSIPKYNPRNTKLNKFEIEKKEQHNTAADQIYFRNRYNNSGSLFRMKANESPGKYFNTFYSGSFNHNIFSNMNQIHMPIPFSSKPNLINEKEKHHNPIKPMTAGIIPTRPDEKLKKGQNQLIYERLLEKVNIKIKHAKKKSGIICIILAATSSHFFKNPRSNNFMTLETQNNPNEKLMSEVNENKQSYQSKLKLFHNSLYILVNQ
jgi:hypothetical protein